MIANRLRSQLRQRISIRPPQIALKIGFNGRYKFVISSGGDKKIARPVLLHKVGQLFIFKAGYTCNQRSAKAIIDHILIIILLNEVS